MNRREALQGILGTAAALALGPIARGAGAEPKRTGLGVVSYCLAHQQKWLKQQNPPVDLAEPLEFLDYCHRLGAGGVQTPLGIRDEVYAKTLRAKAEGYGMYLETMATLPGQESERERFEAHIRTAAAAGARAVRTALMPGRRYEFFDSPEKFREFDQRGRELLQRAVPIVEKHRVRLAVENHKTHFAAEQADLLKRTSSEYVGACVDTGNNLALLEDPIAVVETLAPWAFSVHIKDQGLKEYDEGFLLADVPLGQGVLDLKRMVAILRKARPDVRFSLELITRDALKVPCLTDKYWATFPALPGRDLARTLRLVRSRGMKSLPPVDSLPPQAQVALEAGNIAKSLEYAREHLSL
jgi:3-oxoisoapionate decarboxylase